VKWFVERLGCGFFLEDLAVFNALFPQKKRPGSGVTK
jgi:hypothetical protein